MRTYINDLGLLVLRVGVGLLMMSLHGWGKVFQFSDRAENFADPIGLGPTLSLALVGFAELFCALLVALGLFTRLAAIPVFFTMLTAALVFHANDPWSQKELAYAYMFVYFSIILFGPGRFSVDRFFNTPLNR